MITYTMDKLPKDSALRRVRGPSVAQRAYLRQLGVEAIPVGRKEASRLIAQRLRLADD